jgi:hypothetical protein
MTMSTIDDEQRDIGGSHKDGDGHHHHHQDHDGKHRRGSDHGRKCPRP